MFQRVSEQSIDGNDHTEHAKRHEEWRQVLTRSADLEALSDCDNMLFFGEMYDF